MSIVLIIIMTIIIYVVLENNKIQFYFDQLRDLDRELERRIQPYILSNGEVDIFTVQEIRNMVVKDFLNKHLIDEFKIYKSDMYKLHVVLRRGMAVQGLEMITSGEHRKLIETSMVYSNIEFSKK